jgi:S-adenosylmethionine synthetase
MIKHYFTSESVTDGHPDKICDQIADAILDAALRQDPDSHMAAEVSIKDDLVMIFGECTTKAVIDYEAVALQVIREIGYQEEYHVMTKIAQQSPEITQAVAHDEISAGDQGIMFGYACNETKSLMPAPIHYAHKLTKALSDYKQTDTRFRPDGKSQVTVEYQDGKVKRIDTIVISVQHTPDMTQQELREIVIRDIVSEVIPEQLMDENTRIFVNPSGSFVLGGSWGDSGTTGRKIVCDSYGGMGRVGGGCFSSKDPSKVDRSAAYYCRYVAKNIVAHGFADRCEVGVAYAIGMSDPVSLLIDTFGTAKVSEDEIYKFVNDNFSFKVKDIITELDLKKPIYRNTTNFGHFGREGFSWERIKSV